MNKPRLLSSLFLSCVFIFAAIFATARAEAATFAVIADPHFYNTDLGTEGQAFEDYLAEDRKMLAESEAILASAVKMIKAKKPDFVLVPGDLTKDGELVCHEKFATYLAKLEKAGITVLVCPGNHDINNPHAVSFDGDTTTQVDTVTPEEFAEIYNDYGFGEALYQDSASLSYVAEPMDGLWVLSLDVAKYENNITDDYPETGGAFRDETLAWTLEMLAKARSLGKQVIAMQHHGITEHYTGQSTAFAEYVIDDWRTVSKTLANAGLKMVFTGHYHANDITESTSDDGMPTLFDIETGSLVTYPSPVRFVSLNESGAAIHSEFVKKIKYDIGGASFQEYAENFLRDGLSSIAHYSLINQYGLDENTAAYLTPYVVDAFVAHYAGDETPGEDTLAFIQRLLSSSDSATKTMGQLLGSLWTDLSPADTNTYLDLGQSIHLGVAGTHATGVFDESAAEIVDFDPTTQRLFVANGADDAIDVLDASDPENPAKLFSISVSEYGAGVNSVAVKNSIVAAAVEAETKQDAGTVVFFNTDGTYLNEVSVGALPDMLIFTADGDKVLVANEGEPNDNYTIDPEGSVSIVDISNGVESATVKTVSFTGYNDYADDLKAAGVRIFGPNATVAQDLEPEYIAVSEDSTTAWISCQENNAIVVLDVANAEITGIFALGFKDHSLTGNALDASNKDDAINITTYDNLLGMYQPDAIKAFAIDGQNYLLTANEGDSRDYDDFSEEKRVKKLDLDPTAFPDASTLQDDDALGRLKVTTTLGDEDSDGDYDKLYVYGARSFSILTPSEDGLEMVFDSGSQLECLTAAMLPEDFNSNNDENGSFDARSDDKGPEPEAATVGVIDGKTYAFVGLERVGGIMVYDVSNPSAPVFIQYLNNRDFSGDPESGTAGDLGPEGLVFIPATESPTGGNLLVAANEVSGTTTIYNIETATEVPGDLNNDGIVDRDDMSLIRFHLRQPAEAFPAADLDGDGAITVRDARKIVPLCTCSRCACN